MKQVMYGIKIVDVNDFGGWIGYEPVKQELADVLNHHLYLFFQNEYHIRQFAEGRKFVINVNDEDFQKVIGNARILKAVVEIGTPLSMNGYAVSAPAYARNVVKPLSRLTHFIPEEKIYTFADEEYKTQKTDFNYIARSDAPDFDRTGQSADRRHSFVNQNLLYHYPHYFILGDDQIQIQDDNYQIAGA